MFKGAKILLISLSVICVILLGSTAVLYSMKEGEKTQKLSFQKRLGEVTSVKEDLEKKFKDAETVNAEMGNNIKSLKERMGMLSQQLGEEKTAHTKTTIRLRKKESDLQGLNSKIEITNIEKENLLKELGRLNNDYSSMKFMAENLTKTKEVLENKIKELSEKENVSLGTIVIKQPAKK